MRKSLVAIILLATVLFMGCSIDAERVLEDEIGLEESPEVSKTDCFSCTALEGLELKICGNRDNTYTIFYGGVKMKTIYPEGLEGKTPEEFVAEGCQLEELDFES